MASARSALDVRRHQTAPDLIAEALRREIESGMAQPGEALRQEQLAARFGVSRLPVRDALVRLEAEGLVDIFPNRGAYVARLAQADIGEIYDLRMLLEGDLAARAAKAMNDEALMELAFALERAERGARGPEWRGLDDAFHATLYGPAGRPRQLAMASALRRTVQRYSRAYEGLPAATEDWLEDHRRMVDACRRRDARGARRLVEDHLGRARDLVLRGLAG